MKPTCTPSTQTERDICGRCGGDGKYPSSCYNGVCLGCNGQGFKLTKRGRVADAYLVALRSKPLESLKVGDVVRERFGGLGQIRAFAPVISIEAHTEANATHRILVDSVWVVSPGFKVVLKHPTYGELVTIAQPGQMFRVAQTAEQKNETLRQALAFQDTLNKNGTPYKT